jgi:hypothetical protein
MNRPVKVTLEVENEAGEIRTYTFHQVEPDPLNPEWFSIDLTTYDREPSGPLPLSRPIRAGRHYLRLEIDGELKPLENGECYRVNRTPAGAVLASD